MDWAGGRYLHYRDQYVVPHRLSAEITWHAVKSDMAGLPWRTLAIALAATFVSYFAFSLYDVFAL